MNLTTKVLTISAVVAVGGLLVFTTACPCTRLPGAYLFGEQSTLNITDWRFANDVPLCQIQVTTWRPHSINLNCMSTDQGTLYVSCANCAGKVWSQAAIANGTARLRMGETVYPVNIRRVLDASELDAAWTARLAKIKREPSPRPHHWWSFHLTSRES
ncbi:MAG: hypothetical protein P8L31_13365 [Pseudomonadales bacterium]|nr:hypothetical protein [Pseudomonadales bacterium]